MRNNTSPKKTFIEIGKAYKKGYIEGVDFAIRNYSAVMLICLKDKFDFTTNQLIEVKDYVNDAFDSIITGYVSFDDISATLYDENNIDITFTGDGYVDE